METALFTILLAHENGLPSSDPIWATADVQRE